jgi:hypothetical protein
MGVAARCNLAVIIESLGRHGTVSMVEDVGFAYNPSTERGDTVHKYT